jgi:MOSC domain-containing protein YiiM
VKRFELAARFGAYLRIVAEGDVGAGDPIEVEPAPTGAPTIRDVGLAALDRG